MAKLIRIVTHHENPRRAAQICLEEGVIAIGFVYDRQIGRSDEDAIRNYFRESKEYTEQQVGMHTSTFLSFRDEIKEGDIAIAYAGGNQVALVGEVVGKYQYNEKNRTGNPKGEVYYPNQRKVDWWESPRFFDRAYLPPDLAAWVARPGTLATRTYDKAKLKRDLQKVPSQAILSKALEIQNEKEVQDHMASRMGEVEDGLTMVNREQKTRSGYMDFLAKDKNGTYVAVEVKMYADARTALQVRTYMREYKLENNLGKMRGIIVAGEFGKDCVDEVKELREHDFDINLIRCRKEFTFKSELT